MKVTIAATIAPIIMAVPADAPAVDTPTKEATLQVPVEPEPWRQGLASWHPYRRGDRWTRAAGGTLMMCASRDYAKGTRLEVRRRGRRITVTVGDWGPAEWTGRDLDLSREAFRRLGRLRRGVIDVEWRVSQ